MIKLITEFPVECKICGRSCCSLNSLSAHLIQSHKIKSNDYVIQYLLDGNLPKCKCGCNQPVSINHFSHSSYINHHQIKTQFVELPESKDDWTLPCDGCSKIMKYTNRTSYKGSVNKRRKNGKIYCISCSQKNRVFTEEQKSERSKKVKKCWENKTQEEILQYRKNLSIAQKRRWKNVTDEEYIEHCAKTSDRWKKQSAKEKEETCKKISNARIRYLSTDDSRKTFNPFHNKSTIPYIEDILNVKYDTKFRHGSSEKGEFKIYDPLLNTVYFADAYCSKQNIWIEFDEKSHFKRNGELKDKCVFREKRIRELLDCMFLRIKFEN